MGRRVISVSEDVYRRLSRLAAERNKTINDLIEELLNNYEGKAGGVVERLDRIETMLRDCLDKLGVRQSVETKPSQAEAVPAVPKGEVIGGFEDNPWVQILRVRYGSQNP
ncbi:MAG: antitoxin VapB family protein [Vulcanisaeta sp.]|nr:antitoxin VapB family protein [Vulcanisaeta sp.]